MPDRNPDHLPVIVGVSQLVQRDATLEDALDPLAMLLQIAHGAAADAGLAEAALSELDSVGIVEIAAWKPGNAPALVGEKLAAKPTRQYLTPVGGEASLALVNRMASEILAGESSMSFVAGCNNLKTLRASMKAGGKIDWPRGGSGEPTMTGKTLPGSNDREKSYGLEMPTDIYPIFENAMRYSRGLDFEAHRKKLGALFHPFTKVAAKNPYAWFPIERSAEELTTVAERNRMVSFPYPKYLNAILDTDQAAGALLLSAGKARSLGIPEDRWVYWTGGAQAVEKAWFPTERPSFVECAAMHASSHGALERAGLTVGDIDLFDLYSCFPVAVEMGCKVLGIEEDDPRGLTVTGGLPYAGGPGNNYPLHSIAAMVERLREKGGANGLVTGNGWYLTKHSSCVLSTDAPSGDASLEAGSAEFEAPGPVETLEVAEGGASVLTYTVKYGRDGAPERGIVVGQLDGGERFIANTPDDAALLADFVAEERVASKGSVAHRDGRNVFTPA